MTTFILVVLIVLLLPPLLLLLAPKLVLGFLDTRVSRALKIEDWNRNSAYSRPGFLPQRREVKDGEVRIEGQLPADLRGVYLRNGTNTQYDKVNSRLHMFNGAGMLHQIQIGDGEARYSNTYIRTPRFVITEREGKEVYPEFGDLAGGGKPGLFRLLLDLLKQRLGVIPRLERLANTSNTTAIQFHHGKLYCLQETGFPFVLKHMMSNGRLQLDGSGELETFGGKLQSPFTAHPKVDPKTGDWYAYSTNLLNGDVRYQILSKGDLVTDALLDKQAPAMAFLHDYYVTENYSVFPDVSLRFDSKAMTGEHQSSFYFDPNHKMRFGVIRRDHREGDPVQWFTTDLPGHIWHTINGWEEKRADGGTDIVLFAPVFREYPSTVPIHTPLEPHAHFYKYRLNLETGQVTEQRELLAHFYERPSLNLNFIGKQGRYAYLLDEQASGGIMAKGVLKYDLIDEKSVGYFDYGDFLGGEALFVPSANPTSEDDGYLLDLLMSNEKAYLVVIDARSMRELAKLHLPQRVPYGVHGTWLDAGKLQQLAASA